MLLPADGVEKDPAANAKIIQMIHDYRPQILCVGLGAPKQEYWMHDHITEIAVPVSIGVGASLDFVAGYQKRAPVLMCKIGLEWSWRLMQEPRRMSPTVSAGWSVVFLDCAEAEKAGSARFEHTNKTANWSVNASSPCCAQRYVFNI